ncbi:MAG TPA: hypothetical protein VG095_05130, partial [Chthoniobacterales bacterium]|nr:hypothetical protein [Chthoniobacterales bacterium]
METTVPQIGRALQTSVLTVESLTQMYLARIAAYEDMGPGAPGINAFLHINANALEEARQLDASQTERGPLFGVP